LNLEFKSSGVTSLWILSFNPRQKSLLPASLDIENWKALGRKWTAPGDSL